MRHFLDQGGNADGKKIGAIGQGTAQAIIDRGIIPEFIGEGENTQDIAEQFVQVADSCNVLFPCSDISVRTAQKAFADHSRVHDLVVYQTTLAPPEAAPDADVVVLTSPSNAEALFSSHRPGPH